MAIDESNSPANQPNIDDELQREIDAALGDATLDELMAEATGEQSQVGKATGGAEGDIVSVLVVGINKDDIFVELPDKRQGLVSAEEFEDIPLPEEGQTLELQIRGYDSRDDLVLLSRQGAAVEAAWDTLAKGQVLEGRVTGSNKGGLEIDVDGIQAFMPISQIELFRVEDTSSYINQKFRCQVMEIDKSNRNVVVSRRALLEEEAAEARKELLDKLVEGKVVPGVVKTIMPYGAFVDIGGTDGLLHISDMSHTRVNNPEDVVKVGQQLEVQVLKFDRESGKISLGLKQILADPWDEVAAKYAPDELVTGRVTKLADFGAFVELSPGVEGLIPIGELSFSRINHPSEVIKEGDTPQVRILSVELDRRRISLSLKRVGEDPWMGASVRWPVGSVVEGLVTRTADFGAFVQLTNGVEGLVHISELSDAHVRAVEEVVQSGQSVKVKVVSVDEEARRISLSIKQASAAMPVDTEPEAAPEPQKERKTPLKGGLD